MIRIDNKEIDRKNFPDGTMLIKHLSDDENTKITWLYDNDEECMVIYFLVKHLRTHGVKKIDLLMPYIPNARMDRVKTPMKYLRLSILLSLSMILNSTPWRYLTHIQMSVPR